MEMSDSLPNFLQPVRVLYDPFQTPERREYKSLTRLPRFVGAYVTSVGGTVKARPELAANLSGGGFSIVMGSESYQEDENEDYLERWAPNNRGYHGFYKCARYRDLAFSYFVICAAPKVVATPTSPRKRKITNISYTVRCISWKARPARLRCVIPYSLLLLLYVICSKHVADCQCPDGGGRNLTAERLPYFPQQGPAW